MVLVWMVVGTMALLQRRYCSASSAPRMSINRVTSHLGWLYRSDR